MEVNQSIRAFNFCDTTATRKVFALKKSIRAVTGGTSASKTISILIWIIDYCQTRQKKDKLVSVVSESFPHLDKGVILDFKNIMRDRGYWKDSHWNETKHFYTFETGNTVEFMSVDSYSKAHGPRRDVLFVNECNNLSYKIVDQLMLRTREIVWLDWNPSEEFWFYTEMLGKLDDLDFITLTYLDNEALDEATIRRIESHRNNKNWWTVYGEGKLGEVEGRIYKEWQIIDELPHEARLIRYGMDFGYTNDPTAILGLYRYNGGFVIDEVVYRRGLANRQIADILLNQPLELVMGDSAEPKSIDELKSYGLLVMPAAKGQGSVNAGIQFVQDQRISITKRSVDTIKEYRNYLWATDRDGRTLNVPIGDDHALDALRYAFEPDMVQSRGLDESSIELIARNHMNRTSFR